MVGRAGRRSATTVLPGQEHRARRVPPDTGLGAGEQAQTRAEGPLLPRENHAQLRASAGAPSPFAASRNEVQMITKTVVRPYKGTGAPGQPCCPRGARAHRRHHRRGDDHAARAARGNVRAAARRAVGDDRRSRPSSRRRSPPRRGGRSRGPGPMSCPTPPRCPSPG